MSYADFDPSYAGMDDTYKIGRDLDRAKEYAAKVDFAGKEVKIGTNGSSAAMTMAEIIQANMKEVGITAAINNYDTASWVSVQFDPTMYDLLVCSTGVPSPFAAQAYYGWFTYVDGFNKGTWEGIDRFAELAAVVQNTFDDAERAAMVKELTEIHERESIWYAAVEAQTGLAYNTALQGVEFMLLGNTYYGNWYWTA
jgi:peptide/nickel transport system substrate-binding protein